MIASCQSADSLAQKVSEQYQHLLKDKSSKRDDIIDVNGIDGHFEDGETRVQLEQKVAGCDVYLFQSLHDPRIERSIDQNYIAFLMAARAFKEYGAEHITAILPYLAYSRQDKQTGFNLEPTSAKLMAELSIVAGIDRIISWHPHSPQIRGFYSDIPTLFPTAISFFINEYRRFEGKESVIAVAPDSGAANLVLEFSRKLNLDAAIVSKDRPEPNQTIVSDIIGDFRHKRIAIIIDDMISTGGTMYAVAKKLFDDTAIEDIYIGVSHNLCLPKGIERLINMYEQFNLREVVVTNSIPQSRACLKRSFITVRGLEGLFANIINRIHYQYSLDDLFINED